MVAPRDWLRRAAGDPDVRDSLDAIRAEHGKGSRAYLAALTGVSKDTAGRWLSGKQAPSARVPGRIEAIKRAGGRIAAAKRLRSMRSIRPRMVEVQSLSPVGGGPDGFRQIDTPIELGSMADRIADAWERGDEQGAAEMLSQAIMAGYAGEDPSDDTGLAALLEVTDFKVEPDVMWE